MTPRYVFSTFEMRLGLDMGWCFFINGHELNIENYCLLRIIETTWKSPALHHKNSPHNYHIWQEYQSKGRALGMLKKEEKFAGFIFQVDNQVIQNVSLRFCTLAACFGASARLMQINLPSLSNTLRYEA